MVVKKFEQVVSDEVGWKRRNCAETGEVPIDLWGCDDDRCGAVVRGKRDEVAVDARQVSVEEHR